MSKRLGMNAKMYRSATLMTDDTSAHVAGKTWLEVENIKDLTLNLETGEADVTTRANSGWRATMATLKDGSVEFQMVWDDSDVDFKAVKDAWLNSSLLACMVLTGDKAVNGNEGLAANFSVTNFTRNEALEEAITIDVTLKPTEFQTWYVVGESS